MGQAEDAWRKGNNSGYGYEVGRTSDHINNVRGIGKLIRPSSNPDEIAIYKDGNTYIGVGDSHGPWAVDLPRHVVASQRPKGRVTIGRHKDDGSLCSECKKIQDQFPFKVMSNCRLLTLIQEEKKKKASLSKVAEYTKEEAWEILSTALNQLTRSQNGKRRLETMIGAKGWLFEYRNRVYVTFKHMPSGPSNRLGKSVAITRLEYNIGRDDYTLTLMTNKGNIVKEFEGLYADQLKSTFENTTGLFLTL